MTFDFDNCTFCQLLRRDEGRAKQFVRSVQGALSSGNVEELYQLLVKRGLLSAQQVAQAITALAERGLSSQSDLLEQIVAEVSPILDPGEFEMPQEIALYPADREDFDRIDLIDAWSKSINEAGFELVGDFALRELPIVTRCFLAAPNIFAAVNEHAFGLRWIELVAVNDDETHETWTNTSMSDDQIPPWETRVVVPDASFEDLYARMTSEHSGKNPGSLSASALPDVFRALCRKELQWRAKLTPSAFQNEYTASPEELFPFGTSVDEVLKHRETAEDWELLSNICAIVMQKEEDYGLDSLTRTERLAHAIQGMIREVNNGGFEQFFYNDTGALTYDLVPALDAVGSTEFREVARKAVEIFGSIPSLEEDSRIEHLAKITKEHEIQLWDACDNRFYQCTEQLEAMTLDCVSRHLSDFRS